MPGIPECNRHPKPDINRTQPRQLCAELHVLMDGNELEMRVQGCCMYAVLLADTEFQEVGDRELVKPKKRQSLGCAGAFGFFLFAMANRLDFSIRQLVGTTTASCAPQAMLLYQFRHRRGALCDRLDVLRGRV